VAREAGLTDEENGRGVAVFDMDNDGNEDFLIGNAGVTDILYRGDRQNKNHWLGLELEGVLSNRDAFGARVTLNTKRGTQTRELFPTNGFLSESSKRLLFGVAQGDVLLSASVRWPSGRVQKLPELKLNRYNKVREQTQ
jgi:hypothetical protein